MSPLPLSPLSPFLLSLHPSERSEDNILDKQRRGFLFFPPKRRVKTPSGRRLPMKGVLFQTLSSRTKGEQTLSSSLFSFQALGGRKGGGEEEELQTDRQVLPTGLCRFSSLSVRRRTSDATCEIPRLSSKTVLCAGQLRLEQCCVGCNVTLMGSGLRLRHQPVARFHGNDTET